MRMMIFLAVLALSPLAPSQALAEDAILPPPEVEAAPQERGEVEEISPRQPDLNEQFRAPEKGDEVEVRSYQRKDGARITEYASHGHVFMIKVQPEGGLPAYYLYDSDGDGNFERRLPGGYKRISPPAWVIKRF